MVGLRASAKFCLLDLNEISDLYTVACLGAGAQPCIRTDDTACPEMRALKMGKGADDAAFADMAAAANHDMGFDDHIRFDDGIGGDENRIRGDHCHTRLHRRCSETRLQCRFCGRQIRAVIDTEDFCLVDHNMRNMVAAGGCQRYDIGQVIFALGVIVGHLVQQIKQQRCPGGHDAAIAQPDALLCVSGLAMLDNAFNATVTSLHKAAIPRRIGGFERRHGNRRAIRHLAHDGSNAVSSDKRCVGEHDDGDTVILSDSVTCRGDSAACAKLVFLNRDGGIVQPFLDLARVRRKHRNRPGGTGRVRRVDRPAQHRVPTDTVKRLGKR